jgi:hypothetical protein
MQGTTAADGSILGEGEGEALARVGNGPTQACYRSDKAIVKMLQELEVAATSFQDRPSLASARYMLTRLACSAKAPPGGSGLAGVNVTVIPEQCSVVEVKEDAPVHW